MKKRHILIVLCLIAACIGVVGLSAKSASAVTCTPVLSNVDTTMAWNNVTNHGVADDFSGNTNVSFKRCTGDGGAVYLQVTKLTITRSFTSTLNGSCGTIGSTRVNPEQLGNNLWDPATLEYACTDSFETFEWTAPAGARIYPGSTNDAKCVTSAWGFMEDPQFGSGAYPADTSTALCLEP